MGTSGNRDCQWASRCVSKYFTEDVQFFFLLLLNLILVDKRVSQPSELTKSKLFVGFRIIIIQTIKENERNAKSDIP